MATQADISAKREEVDQLRRDIEAQRLAQAVAASAANLDYQMERLEVEQQTLAQQLQSMRDAEAQAEVVRAFNESSQEERDAAAFAAAREAEEAAAKEAEAVRAAELAAMADGPKDDLMEQAKALEIPGRSSMTKEELAKAIAEAGTNPQGVN